MDLNYLYYRQQVSMMHADRAGCDASRSAHLGLASLYSETIARQRRDRRPPGALRIREGGERT